MDVFVKLTECWRVLQNEHCQEGNHAGVRILELGLRAQEFTCVPGATALLAKRVMASSAGRLKAWLSIAAFPPGGLLIEMQLSAACTYKITENFTNDLCGWFS